MDGPYIRIEESGATIPLRQDVTTVGRGRHVDVQLADPSVSMLHAEIVCRGPYVYVTDLGLSRNGTRVNGRLVGRRLLADGDVVTFGSARCRIGGVACEELSADAANCAVRPAPELTRRELDVVTSLCRPALSDEAFVAPAAAREIAVDLVVTEAAVKQHLLRLYQKFRIAEGSTGGSGWPTRWWHWAWSARCPTPSMPAARPAAGAALCCLPWRGTRPE